MQSKISMVEKSRLWRGAAGGFKIFTLLKHFLKGFSSEISLAKSGINRSPSKWKGPRFSSDFDHSLSCERPLKFRPPPSYVPRELTG
jgi:hypothetical protein